MHLPVLTIKTRGIMIHAWGCSCHLMSNKTPEYLQYNIDEITDMAKEENNKPVWFLQVRCSIQLIPD